MKFHLVARRSAPVADYELQQIAGEDGSNWLRISRSGHLLAVFSAAREGAGVVPVPRVIEVLSEATTARRPEILINASRFLGWEFWPAVPSPLAQYLSHDFLGELTETPLES